MNLPTTNRERSVAGVTAHFDALLAALAAACMLFATPVAAARIAHDVDAGPVLLVANPAFDDPMWREGVLLAAPLPHGGHVGVIINRPTTATLGKLFPEDAASQKVAAPVYFGGPFMAQSVVAVVRTKESPGERAVSLADGLFLAVDAQTIDRIIEIAPDSARYYVGLVLWRPGELRQELARNLWSVRGADVRTVFRTDMKGLWDELSHVSRGQVVQDLAARQILATAR